MDLAKLTLSQLTVTPHNDEMSRLIGRLRRKFCSKKQRISQPITPSCSSLLQIPLHRTRFCVIERSAMWLSWAWVCAARRGAARFRVQIGAALRAYHAAPRDSGRRCAPRHAVSLGCAARFRAPARAVLRVYCAVRCNFERGFAPRCGRCMARRDFWRRAAR